MEYRFLGRSGLKVSALSFGSWDTFGDQVGKETAYDSMVEAYDGGVNYFDNAEEYANGKYEGMMGQILQKTGWRRTDLVLSTEIDWRGPGPDDQKLWIRRIKER